MNLNQVTVPSLDVEKAIQFYEKLELKLIVKSLPDYARFECTDGDSTFSIHRVNELPKGEGVIIYFEDENLDELVSRLLKKGIKFDKKPIDESWLWREASLYDPDGNKIILFYAGKNRKMPPWRVK